jgi:hypothetical protein
VRIDVHDLVAISERRGVNRSGRSESAQDQAECGTTPVFCLNVPMIIGAPLLAAGAHRGPDLPILRALRGAQQHLYVKSVWFES